MIPTLKPMAAINLESGGHPGTSEDGRIKTGLLVAAGAPQGTDTLEASHLESVCTASLWTDAMFIWQTPSSLKALSDITFSVESTFLASFTLMPSLALGSWTTPGLHHKPHCVQLSSG